MDNIQKAIDLAQTFNFSSSRAGDIAVSLLARAIEQGREEQMMERISFHFSRAHDMPEEHKAEEVFALERLLDERCGNSQALRAATLRDGCLYEDSTLENEPLPALMLNQLIKLYMAR